MPFVELMHAYFRGERIEAAAFIAPAGFFLILLAVAAFRAEVAGFRWGVAVPCALFGVVAVATGVGVAARTSSQIATLEQGLEREPAAALAQELPRMRTVMTSFRVYLVAFGVFAAVGLALRFAVRADWARGLGPALVLVGALGLLIDGFAERRARPYVAALEALAREHGVELDSD